MEQTVTPGLGELLRYLNELVDQGAEQRYQDLGLNYRPRYTPVLRAMLAGARTVTEITKATHLTQGAVSQTVALLIADELVARETLEDARKSAIQLTKKGRNIVRSLVPHWEATFAAIGDLEEEIGYPLLGVLQKTASALEDKGFRERLEDAARRASATRKAK